MAEPAARRLVEHRSCASKRFARATAWGVPAEEAVAEDDVDRTSPRPARIAGSSNGDVVGEPPVVELDAADAKHERLDPVRGRPGPEAVGLEAHAPRVPPVGDDPLAERQQLVPRGGHRVPSRLERRGGYQTSPFALSPYGSPTSRPSTVALSTR